MFGSHGQYKMCVKFTFISFILEPMFIDVYQPLGHPEDISKISVKCNFKKKK